MIKETALIFNDDYTEFHKKLINSINKYQEKEYHVEIQYSSSINDNGTIFFSALIIGYSHK
jgi:hypothetical protein